MNPDKINLINSNLGESRLKLKEKLYYHTYTKSPGIAEGFYIATSENELLRVLELTMELCIPYMIIGGGTKLFVGNEGFAGLAIKNRTSDIKTVGVKGKVSPKGIGVEAAMIEVDSGVSVGKLNEYLEKNNLKTIDLDSHACSTIGGALYIDSELRNVCQKVKIWDRGVVSYEEVFNVKIDEGVIISAVFKIKAKE